MHTQQTDRRPAWRLISHPPQPGQVNMDLDLSLLNELDKSSSPATVIRFYAWDKPTVSLGKHQQHSAGADLGYCRREGIPIVHRPSGGRAVLHADELTYAVISNDDGFFPMQSLHQTYYAIGLMLQEGFSRLGIQTDLARSGRRLEYPRPAGPRLPSPCFVTTSRYELLCQGRKIAGSAQRRLRRAFLQHGSIPLSIDYPRMAAALRSSPELLQRSVISVSEAAGRPVGREELEAALRKSFRAKKQRR